MMKKGEGAGGVKNLKKLMTSFMNGPIVFKEIVYKVVDGLQRSEIPVQKLSQHTYIREPGKTV